MKNTIEFENRVKFEEFDKEHLETGVDFEDHEFYVPVDISIKEFMDLQWIVISFEPFTQNPLCLKFKPTTNELVIGDKNDGGHAPRCRIMRIPRQDIYLNSTKLIEWTENRAYKLWL